MKKQKLPFVLLVGLAVVALVLPWQGRTGTVFAQKGNNNKEEARLRNQIKDLQQDVARLKRELNEREQAISKLQAALRKENLDDFKDQVSVKMLKDKDAIIARLQADLAGFANTRAVYSVFYKPRTEGTATAAATLSNDANATLSKVRGVRGLWVGRAAGDSDFQVALVALFDTADDLKKFRDDAAVQRFETKHRADWEQTVREFVRRK